MKPHRRSLRLLVRQWLHAGLIFAFPTAAMGVAVWQLTHAAVQAWMPLLALMSYLLTMLGITVGYHRLLAHRAFNASAAVTATLTLLGAMAAQGAPVYWVSNHRRHHRYSDEPGDPHSPHRDGERALGGWRGFWHAHVLWMFTHELTRSVEFSADLLRNPLIGALNRHYGSWIALGLLLPSALGLGIERSWQGALDGLIWGAGVRLFISYHLTSSINSITHLFGYRSYATREHSRNNPWLGVPTLGEAWHNNHHAFPASARFGLRWWELDIGWWLIRLLARTGLASDVRTPATHPAPQSRTVGQGDEVGNIEARR